jgi:hypothetical protein
MTMDALAGLFLLAALATALVVASRAQQRAAASLTAQRRALAATQRAIEQLQAARRIGDGVHVVNTNARVGSLEWAQVEAEVDGRRVDLMALVARSQPQ